MFFALSLIKTIYKHEQKSDLFGLLGMFVTYGLVVTFTYNYPLFTITLVFIDFGLFSGIGLAPQEIKEATIATH